MNFSSRRPATVPDRLPCFAALLALLTLVPVASAGGGAVLSTTQDGDWADPAVWAGGLLPTPADFVQIDHDLVVTQPGAVAGTVLVGVTQAGRLVILAGELTASQVAVGSGALGVLDVDGGSLTCTNLSVATSLGTSGQVTVAAGMVACASLAVGSPFSELASLVVSGGDASVAADTNLFVGDSGLLWFEPDALDASGLQPLVTGDVTFEPGSQVIARVAEVVPPLGHGWDVVEYTGLLSGSPAGVDGASPGYELQLVESPAVLRVEVSEVPPFVDLGGASVVGAGDVELEGQGGLTPGNPFTVTVRGAQPPLAVAWLSLGPTPFPALGGTVHAHPYINQFFLQTGAGDVVIQSTWPAGIPAGTPFWLQVIAQDLTVADGLVLSNALRGSAH